MVQYIYKVLDVFLVDAIVDHQSDVLVPQSHTDQHIVLFFQLFSQFAIVDILAIDFDEHNVRVYLVDHFDFLEAVQHLVQCLGILMVICEDFSPAVQCMVCLDSHDSVLSHSSAHHFPDELGVFDELFISYKHRSKWTSQSSG